MEENEDEGGNWYWVYSANSCSWNYENVIDFRWSGVQDEDEKDITLAKLNWKLQKQADEENFPKSY